MRQSLIIVCAISLASGLVPGGLAEAYTVKDSATITTTATGSVVESTTFGVSVVQQGSSDVPATLGFEGGANDVRNSGEAIKVTINTNVALNRLIISTDNTAGGANPQYCFDTGNTNPTLGPIGDGGGLVGVPTTADPNFCRNTVPLVWALGVTNILPKTGDTTGKVFTGSSTNVSYNFIANPSGPGATNAVFFTGKAHRWSFTTANTALDNNDLVFCGTTFAVANPDNDGLYPQFFGEPTLNRDLCLSGSSTVTSQELSKNIAVVGFGFSGTKGNIPRLDTAASDDIVEVNSPLYLPVAADFRGAAPGTYSTNKIVVELVTQ